MELTDPVYEEDDLSYTVAAVGDTILPQTMITCEGESHMFIDPTSDILEPGRSCTRLLFWLAASATCEIAEL